MIVDASTKLVQNWMYGANNLISTISHSILLVAWLHGFSCDIYCFNFFSSSHVKQKLLQEDSLAHAPFLILGNKIDLAGAAPEAELRDALGLSSLTTGKMVCPPSLLPTQVSCCAIRPRRSLIFFCLIRRLTQALSLQFAQSSCSCAVWSIVQDMQKVCSPTFLWMCVS
jgi:hypothetical protein